MNGQILPDDSMTMDPSTRDQRIDLLRGIALLILVTDHLPRNPLSQLMPVSWGLADMAEVFVLLSGYVFGIGLQKPKSTFMRCRRSFQRLFTLYSAYVLTAFFLIVLVKTLHIASVASLLPPHMLGNSLMFTTIDILTLNGRVTHLCVLLLYFWLGLGMLILPHSSWKHARLLFGFSLLLYGLTQASGAIALPKPLQSTTYYNPFSWQFLFVTGSLLSLLTNAQRQRVISNSRVLALALVIQGGLLLLVGSTAEIPVFLKEKSTLGLLRYLHVISGVAIVFAVLPEKFSSTAQRILRPFFICSEQSIWVYCVGSLIVVALSDWSMTTPDFTIALLVNILAWSGCVGIGVTVACLKTLWRNEKQIQSNKV